MKFVALISGGKDGIYSAKLATDHGHNLVAFANLYPEEKDELDSHMFQTIGHEMIEHISEACEIPVVRQPLIGKSEQTSSVDISEFTDSDEVSDLEKLLIKCQEKFEGLQAVSCGAILSDYQRCRVELVCKKLGLINLSPIWQMNQVELVESMIESGMEVVLSKVATMGLKPIPHVGMNIKLLFGKLKKLSDDWGINAAGEGGEFESLVLYCPGMYKSRIKLVEKEVILDGINDDGSVGYLKVKSVEFEKAAFEEKKPKCSEKCLSSLTNLDFSKSFQEYPTVHPPLSKHFDNTDSLVISNIYATINKTDIQTGTNSSKKPDIETVKLSVQLAFTLLETQLKLHKFSKSDIACVRLYVSNLDQYSVINQVYAEYFGIHSPARVCLGVDYPEKIVLSMEVIATRQKVLKKVHVESQSFWAPAMIGPYSQAMVYQGFCFISGMIGLKSFSMVMGDSEEQEILPRQHVDAVKSVLSLEKFQKKSVVLEWRRYNEIVYFSDQKSIETPNNDDNNEVDDKEEEQPYDQQLETLYISNLPKNANLEVEEILWNPEVSKIPEILHFENLTDFKTFVLANRKNDEFSIRLFHSSNPEYFNYNLLAKDVLMNAQFRKTKTLSTIPVMSDSSKVMCVIYYY